MLRWLGPAKVTDASNGSTDLKNGKQKENITDDPLATIETGHKNQKSVYSVSRSVLLPRVSLKNSTLSTDSTAIGGGVNPLFLPSTTNASQKVPVCPAYPIRPARSREKSSSSGYGDSNTDSFQDTYQEHLKLMEEVGVLLERNPAFVKSIKIAARGVKSNKSVPFQSNSSLEGTLTTIPEGEDDLSVPRPIWPHQDKLLDQYDSIVDDALLLYTSLNYRPENVKPLDTCIDISVKDLLLEILNGINETLEGKNTTPPENMLKIIDSRIRLKLEALKVSTEEEMRRLCVNLTNCRKKNSVLRALSNSTSSGNSSKTSSSRIRTLSSETEEVYELPSRSSSSGFSDSLKEHQNVPVFVHDNLVSVPNIVRNALIYGTLCRAKAGNEGLLKKSKKIGTISKKTLMTAVNDDKPSVWEQYYGVKAVEEGDVRYPTKPTDVPLYPVGRPEADFTLDVPRSEHLLKRMKNDKKWRCRCRLLTSFFGLIFFLLSVMAVSLILTRGKRMFGSMV
ncbi:unnamed protein product [Psylliodes chrysocephalus]|uniref:Uncharacterized protein n=1 Tax=Psylliodes chrysocephalus TaxID=3402493 RepID=A0A9P0DC40_9CUCU|nr:unnamed protein product [Psylliodes chrysocephala]